MDKEITTAYYTPDNRSRWQKLLCRIFPAHICRLPEAPAHYKDVIHSKTDIHIDWIDRLRILISGRARLDARIVTENEAGATIAASVFYVCPPSRTGANQ